MLTNSQIKLCDCTLVRSPMTTPFWISVKGPMKQSSPMAHSYRLDGSTTVQLRPNWTERMEEVYILGFDNVF